MFVRMYRTSVVLLPLLASKFPFYLSDVYILQCYVENLLQVAIYSPKLRSNVLRITFVELTKIDVRCSDPCCFFLKMRRL